MVRLLSCLLCSFSLCRLSLKIASLGQALYYSVFLGLQMPMCPWMLQGKEDAEENLITCQATANASLLAVDLPSSELESSRTLLYRARTQLAK